MSFTRVYRQESGYCRELDVKMKMYGCVKVAQIFIDVSCCFIGVYDFC